MTAVDRRQLDTRVDRQVDLGIAGDEGRDGGVRGEQQMHEVSQIELALGVVGGQAWQRGAQSGGVEDVGADVDLVDLALGRRRVLVLDDARHSARPRRARRDRSAPGSSATTLVSVAAAPAAR